MKIRKYQDGGAVATPDAQMAAEPMGGVPQEQGQDPLMEVINVAAQALQTQNCEAAMAVCEALLMLVQEAEGAAPMGEPQGEPVFKKGGKMVKEGKGIRKAMNSYTSAMGNKVKAKEGKGCK